MDAPKNNINNDDIDLIQTLVVIWNALLKNALGILSILFGVTMKIHLIRGKFLRMAKWQCWTAIVLAGLSGIIAWFVVRDLPIRDLYKAIAVGYTPVFIEPITMRLLVWIDPIVDEIGTVVKKYINKKSNK
mgnify:CR=1 FL=1